MARRNDDYRALFNPFGGTPLFSHRIEVSDEFPVGAARNDDGIREEVIETLRGSDDLSIENLEVEVSAGSVTVKGIARVAIQQRVPAVVAQVAGVKEVHNDIKIGTA